MWRMFKEEKLKYTTVDLQKMISKSKAIMLFVSVKLREDFWDTKKVLFEI